MKMCLRIITISILNIQHTHIRSIKKVVLPHELIGPMERFIQGAEAEIGQVESKLWICKGRRSMAVAVKLLQQGKVVAIPTDTIYGLAVDAMQTDSIKRLYEIKGRDENKPLCICVGNTKYIDEWCVTNHLPNNLIRTILPGPYTIVLKRTPALNPDLNPGIDTVGIRVPDSKFIRILSHFVGPLALTSANLSNERSCLYPEEFKNLWPRLDGIFINGCGLPTSSNRLGSTIVDLSIPNHYKIVRIGLKARSLISILKSFNLEEVESSEA